jgi:methylmalonyl-CoA/ethylmalonyl-CoA epimerase
MRTFQEGATMQVAMVVRDMDAAMKRHWDVFKIGPWDIYTFDATRVSDYTYRGKPATHSCLIAVAWSGDTQLELMQPLTGYSIYDEHLVSVARGSITSSFTTKTARRPPPISPAAAIP